jgi:hypothetical protein
VTAAAAAAAGGGMVAHAVCGYMSSSGWLTSCQAVSGSCLCLVQSTPSEPRGTTSLGDI